MDQKGRIAIPVRFRADIGNRAVITRGLDKSLFIYTKDEWGKLASKIASLPMAKANSRAFSRLMLAGAYEIEIDKQGRSIVPENLRRFAGLSKRIVLAGVADRIEVWDEAVWEEYKTVTEKESTSIAETLSELGV